MPSVGRPARRPVRPAHLRRRPRSAPRSPRPSCRSSRSIRTSRSEVSRELADAGSKINELTERKIAAEDQLQRQDIQRADQRHRLSDRGPYRRRRRRPRRADHADRSGERSARRRGADQAQRGRPGPSRSRTRPCASPASVSATRPNTKAWSRRFRPTSSSTSEPGRGYYIARISRAAAGARRSWRETCAGHAGRGFHLHRRADRAVVSGQAARRPDHAHLPGTLIGAAPCAHRGGALPPRFAEVGKPALAACTSARSGV